MFRRPAPENFVNYQVQASLGRQPTSGKIPIKRRKKTRIKKRKDSFQLRAQDIDKRRSVYRPDRLLAIHQSSLNNATRTAQEVGRGLTSTGTTLGFERQQQQLKDSALIESRAKTELFNQVTQGLKSAGTGSFSFSFPAHRQPDGINPIVLPDRPQAIKELGYREPREAPEEETTYKTSYSSHRLPNDDNSNLVEPLLTQISQDTTESEGQADIEELLPTPTPEKPTISPRGRATIESIREGLKTPFKPPQPQPEPDSETTEPPPPPTPQPPEITRPDRPKGVSKAGVGQVQSVGQSVGLQRQGTAPPPPEPEPQPEPERERGGDAQQRGVQVRSKMFPISTTSGDPTPQTDPYTALEDPDVPFKQDRGDFYNQGNLIEGTFNLPLEVQDQIGASVQDERDRLDAERQYRSYDNSRLATPTSGSFNPQTLSLVEGLKELDPDIADRVGEDLGDIRDEQVEDVKGWKQTDLHSNQREWKKLTKRQKDVYAREMYNSLSRDDDDFEELVDKAYKSQRFQDDYGFVDDALGEDGYDSDISEEGAIERGFEDREGALSSLEEARDVLDSYERGGLDPTKEEKIETFKTMIGDGIFGEVEAPEDGGFSVDVDEDAFRDYYSLPFAITGYYGDERAIPDFLQTQSDSEEEETPSRQSSVASRQSSVASSQSSDEDKTTINFAGEDYQLRGDGQLIREDDFGLIDGRFEFRNGKLFKLNNNDDPKPVTTIMGDTAFVPEVRPEPEPEPEPVQGKVEDITDVIADDFLTEVDGAFGGGKLFKKTGNKKQNYQLDPDQQHYLVEIDGKKYVVIEHNPRKGSVLLQTADTINIGDNSPKNRKNIKKDKLLKLIQAGDVPLQKISSNYKG